MALAGVAPAPIPAGAVRPAPALAAGMGPSAPVASGVAPPTPVASGMAPAAPVAAGAAAAEPAAVGSALDEQVWRAPVAPGIDLLAVRRLDGHGWLDLFALLVDLTTPGVGIQTLTPPAVTLRERTSELVRQAGAAAGINGDFFYLGATDAPVGLVVREGVLWKGPDPFGRPTLAVLETPQGLTARIGTWRLRARAWAADGGELALDGWNESAVRPGQVVAFDERWGSAPLPLTRAWGSELAYARLRPVGDGMAAGAGPMAGAGVGGGAGVSDGAGEWEVVEAGRGPTGPPGPGERVLLGWREGAERLLAFAARGGRLRLELQLLPADGPAPPGTLRAAVSGEGWLIQAGRPIAPAAAPSQAPGSLPTPQPRAAAGVDRSGRRLVLAVADGRRPTSRGLTGDELTLWLLRLGAWDALYLDGGGSATLVADLTGRGPAVVNRPAGGEERPVPVALGLFYRPGSGPMAPFVLRPAVGLQAPDPEGYSFGFAGLLSAPGIPARLEVVPPAEPDSLVWSVDPPDLGYFDRPGQFVGLREGHGHIVAVRALGPGSWQQGWNRAEAGGTGNERGDPVAEAAAAVPMRWAAAASIPVRVIGQPVALEVEPSPVELAEGEEVALRVQVRDRLGRAAPVAPGLITFWVDGPADVQVHNGRLRVERVWDEGPLWLQARYADLKATVPIRIRATGTPATAAGATQATGGGPPQASPEVVSASMASTGEPEGTASKTAVAAAPQTMVATAPQTISATVSAAASAPAELPTGQARAGLRVLILPHPLGPHPTAGTSGSAAAGRPGNNATATRPGSAAVDRPGSASADSAGSAAVELAADAVAGSAVGAAADLTVVLATDREAARLAEAPQAPGRSAVLGVRVADGHGSAGLSAFVRQFGWPNAVATRSATRFLALDPSLHPWAWLDGELRRLQAEGLKRLMVFTGEPPQRWPVRREGEMVHGWLAETARQGVEVWWVHADPQAASVQYRVRDGIHYLAVPRPEPSTGPSPPLLQLVVTAGGVQVQTLDRPA